MFPLYTLKLRIVILKKIKPPLASVQAAEIAAVGARIISCVTQRIAPLIGDGGLVPIECVAVHFNTIAMAVAQPSLVDFFERYFACLMDGVNQPDVLPEKVCLFHGFTFFGIIYAKLHN